MLETTNYTNATSPEEIAIIIYNSMLNGFYCLVTAPDSGKYKKYAPALFSIEDNKICAYNTELGKCSGYINKNEFINHIARLIEQNYHITFDNNESYIYELFDIATTRYKAYLYHLI